MLLNNDIHQLYHNKTDHESFLLDYVKIANDLMYQSEDFIREVTSYLISEIYKQSRLSKVYQRHHGIISKPELVDTDEWYIKKYNAFENSTSGSTGQPFKYLIWRDTYDLIECENHYKAITNEFNIYGPAKILYLHHDITIPNTAKLIDIHTTKNPLVSHGLRHQAEIHHAVTNRTFYTNYYKYYEEIIDYAIKNNIDIIHANSNTIASLAWNVKRLNIKNKLCRLLSNTESKLDINQAIELQQNGNIDTWCDHMRCWDGGVTFFTCKYNTYHLIDGLAWTYTDNYKLISHDYFSLPSPFVDYWNGDYAEIAKNYERCKCGRAFRKFEIGRVRSKISQISEISTIQSALVNSDLLDGLKRIEIIKKFMRIFTKYSFTQDRRRLIRNVLPSVDIQFTVEEDING